MSLEHRTRKSTEKKSKKPAGVVLPTVGHFLQADQSTLDVKWMPRLSIHGKRVPPNSECLALLLNSANGAETCSDFVNGYPGTRQITVNVKQFAQFF
jgi:hypothetical protein